MDQLGGFGESAFRKTLQTQLALGDILLELGQPQPARACFEKALGLAKTIEPEFQIRSISGIEKLLRSVANAN